LNQFHQHFLVNSYTSQKQKNMSTICCWTYTVSN